MAKHLVGEGQLVVFHGKFFPPGHAATNITRWMSAEAPYEIAYAKVRVDFGGCLDASGVPCKHFLLLTIQEYEPYVVVARRCVPWYDERFRGRGYNKASHILQMHGENGRFCRQSTAYHPGRPAVR